MRCESISEVARKGDGEGPCPNPVSEGRRGLREKVGEERRRSPCCKEGKDNRELAGPEVALEEKSVPQPQGDRGLGLSLDFSQPLPHYSQQEHSQMRFPKAPGRFRAQS